MELRATGIDHVVLNVTDMESSVAWYRDRLGLEVLRLDAWRRGEVPFVSLRLTPTTLIDLLEAAPDGTNVDHIALTVDADLDAVVASGDFDVEFGPMELYGAQGMGQGVYVRDPDGHRVELRTYPE